jgi:hypothetical protein
VQGSAAKYRHGPIQGMRTHARGATVIRCHHCIRFRTTIVDAKFRSGDKAKDSR